VEREVLMRRKTQHPIKTKDRAWVPGSITRMNWKGRRIRLYVPEENETSPYGGHNY
jgi:hypothetical protein